MQRLQGVARVVDRRSPVGCRFGVNEFDDPPGSPFAGSREAIQEIEEHVAVHGPRVPPPSSAPSNVLTAPIVTDMHPVVEVRAGNRRGFLQLHTDDGSLRAAEPTPAANRWAGFAE